jgi:aryl-phospho-beta-D-glucosidase BglC (GH1 family)
MMHSRTIYSIALLLVASCGVSDPSPDRTPEQKTASLLPSGYLHTNGNQIVDGGGSPVRLACAGYLGPTRGDIAGDMTGMASAGINCLRYPWFNGTMQSDLAMLDQIVPAASAAGIKVILDHHGNEVPGPNNGWLPYPCNGLPFDSGAGTNGTDDCGDTGTVDESRYVNDWVTMAQHFAGNATVIGVDLTNEPHLAPTYWQTGGGGATWGDGGPTDIRRVYSEVGNAIESADPGLLLICEGPFAFSGVLYNGQTAAISGVADLTLAASMPVSVNVPDEVVYSVHNYPSTIGGATADSGSLEIQSMNQAWGYLVSQNIAPVWIGEMGASLDGLGPDSANGGLADEQAWASTLVPYLNGQDGAQGGPTFSGNQQPIGTDWWAWGNLDGEAPDGTLLDDGKLRPEQYAVYGQLQFTGAATSCQSSPDPTIVTTVGPTICDGAGNTWALNSDGTIALDGGAAPYSANVIELAYVAGVLWQENADHLWWQYSNGGWSPSAGTSTAPVCTPSANDTTVTTTGPVICDAAGNTWALASDGTIALDGGAAPYSANVIELAYVGGVVWQENASQLWWAYQSGGWSPTDGTSTPPL